jgi:protein-S-isoprenylcysteine O-methyltransferase Ste14
VIQKSEKKSRHVECPFPLSAVWTVFETFFGAAAMRRILVLTYGVTVYLGFLAVFLYLAGFVGGFLTPTQIDGPPRSPMAQAIAVDALLIALFAVQHTVMARPGFKRWWTKLVPHEIERSTYVLFTNLVLVVTFWQWQPISGVIWELQDPLARSIAWSLFATGWLVVLITTFLINHFDLFGLRHVWLYFGGWPYQHLRFATPGPYRFVRHPLYVGWLMAFWATPRMTVAHAAFALGMTVYILIAIVFEERDLMAFHEGYAAYRRRVPMLIPRFGFHARDAANDSVDTLETSPRSYRGLYDSD